MTARQGSGGRCPPAIGEAQKPGSPMQEEATSELPGGSETAGRVQRSGFRNQELPRAADVVDAELLCVAGLFRRGDELAACADAKAGEGARELVVNGRYTRATHSPAVVGLELGVRRDDQRDRLAPVGIVKAVVPREHSCLPVGVVLRQFGAGGANPQAQIAAAIAAQVMMRFIGDLLVIFRRSLTSGYCC